MLNTIHCPHFTTHKSLWPWDKVTTIWGRKCTKFVHVHLHWQTNQVMTIFDWAISKGNFPKKFACCYDYSRAFGSWYFHHLVCYTLVSHIQSFTTCIIGHMVIVHSHVYTSPQPTWGCTLSKHKSKQCTHVLNDIPYTPVLISMVQHDQWQMG